MKCPKCNFSDTKLVDSRPEKGGRAIRRRRACEHCGFRFSTIERGEIPRIIVRKKDGRGEDFSREKLERAIEVAARKRPVSEETIRELVRDLAENWAGSGEISSAEIGDATLDAIREIDEIAFLRFASVYQTFETLEEFRKKLDEMR